MGLEALDLLLEEEDLLLGGLELGFELGGQSLNGNCELLQLALTLGL